MSDLFKRRGKFEISDEVLHDESARDFLRSVFSNAIIVKAEHDFMRGAMIYCAYSERFDVTQDGYEVRPYTISVNSETGEVSFI